MTGSARALLADEHGLLADAAFEDAGAEMARWHRRGIQVCSPFDSGYPQSLREVPDRPLLLFVVGRLLAIRSHAIAVIGTRQPTPQGKQVARAVSHRLAEAGYTVVSGLAAGIDTVAHEATLEKKGSTVAVIGSGVDHSYPRENIALQRRIGQEGAVISQFWPESQPSRSSFPQRNALMAGLTEASVIVEAGAMSGTRIQARAALNMRRIVVLLEPLLEQAWAQELAERPGVAVAGSPAEVAATLERSLRRSAVA